MSKDSLVKCPTTPLSDMPAISFIVKSETRCSAALRLSSVCLRLVERAISDSSPVSRAVMVSPRDTCPARRSSKDRTCWSSLVRSGESVRSRPSSLDRRSRKRAITLLPFLSSVGYAAASSPKNSATYSSFICPASYSFWNSSSLAAKGLSAGMTFFRVVTNSPMSS